MQTTIPELMQAVVVDEKSGGLAVREISVPRQNPGQVLIRMAAAPINPSDIGFTKGSYSVQKADRVVPGFEGSGIVVAAGSGIFPRLMVGRRVVCSTPSGGTWAEYLVVSAGKCFPLSKNLSFEAGSMLIVNPLTAVAFFEIAKRGKHKAMINHAAAGALGQMILRMGQSRHIPVIHIVRREAQVELLRSMGAEHILNSTDADFDEKLHYISHQLKATLILDPVGGEQTLRLLNAGPSHSTALVYGSLSGVKNDPAAQTLTDSTKHIEGFYLPDWLRTKNILQVLWKLRQVQRLAANELHTNVQGRFPLAQIQEALELYQANPTAGKVLLVSNMKYKHDLPQT